MEIIEKFIERNDDELGYEIITNKQTISIFISNYGDCCERWGFITTEDTLSDFIGSDLKSINFIDEKWETHPLTKNNEIVLYEGGAVFIDMITSKGTLQFVIYNDHNGYYGHNVKIISNQLTYDEYI